MIRHNDLTRAIAVGMQLQRNADRFMAPVTNTQFGLLMPRYEVGDGPGQIREYEVPRVLEPGQEPPQPIQKTVV